MCHWEFESPNCWYTLKLNLVRHEKHMKYPLSFNYNFILITYLLKFYLLSHQLHLLLAINLRSLHFSFQWRAHFWWWSSSSHGLYEVSQYRHFIILCSQVLPCAAKSDQAIVFLKKCIYQDILDGSKIKIIIKIPRNFRIRKQRSIAQVRSAMLYPETLVFQSQTHDI